MPVVTQSGMAISGHEEAKLKLELDLFHANSPAASGLLTQASKVKITSDPGSGDIHANGAGDTVEIFWQKKLAGGGTSSLPVNEIVESTLFEIKNAVNAGPRNAATMPLKHRCLHFGIEFSKIEAQSSFITATILKERASRTPNYTRSIWGENQVKAVGNRNLMTFQTVFVNLPHDPNGIGPFRLKSKHLYAYERIPLIYNLRVAFGKMLTIRHAPVGRQPTTSANLGRSMAASTSFRTGFGIPSADAKQVFIWLMYGVLAIEQEQFWTVTWNDGLSTLLWVDFLDEVVARVATIQKDLTKIQTIKQMLMGFIG